jgi:SAM-dependent methyltransferase
MSLDYDIKTLTSAELATLFGTVEEEIKTYCGSVIHETDLRYRFLEQNERDQLILKVIKIIYSGELAKSGKDRQPDWEHGWRENLNEFLTSGYNLDRLVPKYFKKNVPARLNLEYIMPISPNFVFSYTHIYRTWLFLKYFQEVSNVYEFGCGPAYHLAYLAQLYPDKRLFGLDWAISSQEIIQHLAAHFKWKIEGRRFDFFQPDPDLFFERNSGILTFGALEQVGENHGPFLNLLLKNRPSICVNVECLHELYGPENLLSYLALQYHNKRNYLFGYLTKLRRLEEEKQIEIIKVHYHKFGNVPDDALSYVVWKPK